MNLLLELHAVLQPSVVFGREMRSELLRHLQQLVRRVLHAFDGTEVDLDAHRVPRQIPNVILQIEQELLVAIVENVVPMFDADENAIRATNLLLELFQLVGTALARVELVGDRAKGLLDLAQFVLDVTIETVESIAIVGREKTTCAFADRRIVGHGNRLEVIVRRTPASHVDGDRWKFDRMEEPREASGNCYRSSSTKRIVYK